MSERVLIVDDNEDVRRILALRFRHAGFDVESAADGAQGLAALRRARWDLVLLDLVMPDVDGFQFLEELRDRPRPLPPVVVITQYDDAENRRRALGLGAAGYVGKASAFAPGFAGSVRRWMEQGGAISGDHA